MNFRAFNQLKSAKNKKREVTAEASYLLTFTVFLTVSLMYVA